MTDEIPSLLVIAACLAYFIPAFVAKSRGKRDLAGITILNLFGGWTLIGWVVALVWACLPDDPPKDEHNEPA